MCKSTVGYKLLEHKSISADDVTWAILPYVHINMKNNKGDKAKQEVLINHG